MEDINCWEEKFEMCGYATRLLDSITSLNKLVQYPVDLREIKKGIYYARKYHGTQMRQSGDPYYSHPVEVAYMLAEFTAIDVPKLFIPSMINAALLHDTIEDTPLTEDNIAKIFDRNIANKVEGLTRVKPYGKISAEESLNLLVQQKRHETALIKLFDRIHNVQTLGAKSPEKAKKVIQETIKSFLTLAVYLGIKNIEKEIIRLCTNVINLPQKFPDFSIENDPALPFLTFQNEITQKQILYLLALK